MPQRTSKLHIKSLYDVFAKLTTTYRAIGQPSIKEHNFILTAG